MTRPGNDQAVTAAGRGNLRASHADREQVIGTLKAAFVRGMLAKDEFDLRVSQAFASRTYAELDVITVDLPAMPTAAQPPNPARAQGQRRLLRPGPVIMAATAVYAGIWVPAFLLPSGPGNPQGDPPQAIIALFISSNVICPLVVAIALVFMIAGWRQKRASRRPPQRPAPGAGRQESRWLSPADPGGELPRGGHGHQHTAETERSRPSRPPRRARGHNRNGALAACLP